MNFEQCGKFMSAIHAHGKKLGWSQKYTATQAMAFMYVCGVSSYDADKVSMPPEHRYGPDSEIRTELSEWIRHYCGAQGIEIDFGFQHIARLKSKLKVSPEASGMTVDEVIANMDKVWPPTGNSEIHQARLTLTEPEEDKESLALAKANDIRLPAIFAVGAILGSLLTLIFLNY